MHYLPLGARLNKGILMVTQLIAGFRGVLFLIFTAVLDLMCSIS